MQKHRSEWDVTTLEGRNSVERFLMERMGCRWIGRGWNNPSDHRLFWVPHGWIFTGDGMVLAKKWAAEKKGIVISSEFHPDGSGRKAQGIARCWDLVSGKELALERADIEEEAVALALARALEEMER